MTRFAIVLAVILILCNGCESDRSTGSTQPLHYPDESVDLALYISGEIRAPHNLTATIDRELFTLRSQWQDSMPFVGTPFFPPWGRSAVHLTIENAYIESFRTERLGAWRKIRDQYHLKLRQYEWFDQYFTAYSSEPLHSVRLAEQFVGMTGVQSVSTGSLPHPYGPICLRATYGGESHYFFETDACPDLYSRYDHFVIDVDSAIHIGTHWQCPPNTDSMFFVLPFDEFIAWQQAWIDSSAANAPAWLDTAFAVIGHWSSDPGFGWSHEEEEE